MAGDRLKCKILDSGICMIAECWHCPHVRLRINSAAHSESHLKLTENSCFTRIYSLSLERSLEKAFPI